MVGDPAPLLVAGAWAFGARRFDAAAAFAAMSRTATASRRGRTSTRATRRRSTARAGARSSAGPGLADYLARGYVPLDHDDGLHLGAGRDDARVRARRLRDSAASRARPGRRSGERRSRAARRAGAGSSTRPRGYLEPRLADGSFPRRLLAHVGERLRRGELDAVHVVRAARRRRADRGCSAGPRRRAPGSTASTQISTRAISRRTRGSATSRASARRGSTTGSVRRGGRRRSCARAVDTLFRPLPGRPAGRRRPRRALGVVRLERARPLPGRPGVGGLAIGEPALPERHDPVRASAGSGSRRPARAPTGRTFTRSRLDGRATRRTWLPVSALRGDEDAAVRAALDAGSALGHGGR